MFGRLRVAVASSQGQKVDLHFGHADQFLVFDLTGGPAEFLEARRVESGEEDCQGLEDLDAVVDLLSDCQVVVSRRFGPHARSRLSARGICAQESSDTVLESLAQVREQLLKESLMANG